MKKGEPKIRPCIHYANVRFFLKRSLRLVEISGFERPLSARSSRSSKSKIFLTIYTKNDSNQCPYVCVDARVIWFIICV